MSHKTEKVYVLHRDEGCPGGAPFSIAMVLSIRYSFCTDKQGTLNKKKRGENMPTATIPIIDTMSRGSGTIALTVSRDNLIESKEQLLVTGDFSLYLDADTLTLESQGEKVELDYTIAFNLGHPVLILWSWLFDSHRLVLYDKTNQKVETIVVEDAIAGQFDLIQLATQPYWKGHLEGVAIYTNELIYDDISYYVIDNFLTDEETSFKVDYTSGIHYSSEVVIETTMAPRDHSPVLVSNNKGRMNRQYFFNQEDGLYQKENTETFLYRNEDVFHLSYDELDPTYIVTVAFENGEVFTAEHVNRPLNLKNYSHPFEVEHNEVRLNLTEEQKEEFYGTLLDITYQLDNSYNVEYNDDVAYDSLRVNIVNHDNSPVQVIQEGNRFSNQRLAKEIELNPLLNAQHSGFLYIDRDEQHVQAFRLNTSSPYVTADGADSADFIIEAIDAEGNEVLNPEIEVYLLKEDGRIGSDLGTIHPIITKETLKARRTSGRCYYRYKAPFIRLSDNPLVQRIFLVAYDRKSGLGAQVPLFIRPTNQMEVHNITEESANKASLPFEMMTRYLNQDIDSANPVLLLDFNRNGILDDEDFAYLEANKTNLAMMTSLDASLRIHMGINRDEMDVPS